jgi:hypothetical protein
MHLESFLYILGVMLTLHVITCISYTKEIYYWVPSLKNKILMLLVLWLIPILGFIYIHRHKLLKHMRSYKEGSADEGNAISSGMLEIDSVFNPGARNHIEAVRQQKVTRQAKAKKNKKYTPPDFETLAPYKKNNKA